MTLWVVSLVGGCVVGFGAALLWSNLRLFPFAWLVATLAMRYLLSFKVAEDEKKRTFHGN